VCCRFGANKLPESRTHHFCVNAAASVDDDQQVLPHLAAAQRGMRWFSLLFRRRVAGAFQKLGLALRAGFLQRFRLRLAAPFPLVLNAGRSMVRGSTCCPATFARSTGKPLLFANGHRSVGHRTDANLRLWVGYCHRIKCDEALPTERGRRPCWTSTGRLSCWNVARRNAR
jgi:hypothetical protein